MSVRRILVAGSNGMLGTALRAVAPVHGIRVDAPAEHEFDITDGADIERHASRLAREGGGLLVNAAAYTNVDGAEADADRAYRVNEDGPRMLASAAAEHGLGFVHVSTDFVFDGTKDGAYSEDDEPNPLSVYGASKLAGERAVLEANDRALVVRTAWVFGPAGANFPTKILEAARTRDRLTVVTDQVGSPTYTFDLAACILELAEKSATGLFHLANAGSCSRYELALAVLANAGIDTPVDAIVSTDLPAGGAHRPANSVLDCSKAAGLGVVMPVWRNALARFMASAGLTPDTAAAH